MTARYIIGDTRTVTAGLPDNSVDLILTSPPFLALRSYLPADHPDKASEIGSEATPAEFLDVLLALTAEWERVLTPHGSICVELGDTYAGNVAFDGTDSFSIDKGRGKMVMGGTGPVRNRKGHGWPLDKSLTGIPHLYHLSLAYGRNLLTGEPSPAGQWRVRNVVAWVRPNPPVGALGDKFRPATSYMTIATKSRTRWFDLDAVRTESAYQDDARHLRADRSLNALTDRPDDRRNSPSNPAGAPPLDWWNVSTEPYKGSHYATWPRALCVTPIRAMCPASVCNVCGEPRRRITEPTAEYAAEIADQQRLVGHATNGNNNSNPQRLAAGLGQSTKGHRVQARQTETLGFTDCGHDDYRRGVVFDPFAGSGTTLAVAEGNGRDSVGIDIDARNADLAYERCGMFLQVEDAA